MKKSLILAMSVIIISSVLFAGCGAAKTTIDFESLTNTEVTGYNGYADLRLRFSTKALEDLVWDETFNHAVVIENFADSVKYTYNNYQNLKNGDRVEIQVDYNENIAETLGIRVANNKFFVTVEGLEELREVKLSDVIEVSIGSAFGGGVAIQITPAEDFEETFFSLNINKGLKFVCDEFPEPETTYDSVNTQIRANKNFLTGDPNNRLDVQEGQTITLRAVYDPSSYRQSSFATIEPPANLEELLSSKGFKLESDSAQFTLN
ncbi:MAG: hypothetical protein FWH08_01340 [Oscillospiraceae bacterium]|nr:hypothetical protein [Oscillospiraceae bacterium]